MFDAHGKLIDYSRIVSTDVPPGWTLGDICGNVPGDEYQPPSPPPTSSVPDYDVVDDLNGGWTFEEKKPPPEPIDPYEGIEP